ncbi:MAG: GAF domain-containing protein [Chitinophagaceae bacterium]|nr:MAG: GAF domain-containing protein [Chitinophagaceae bacterium]
MIPDNLSDSPFQTEFSFGRLIERLRAEYTHGSLRGDEATRKDLEQIDEVPALVTGITDFSQIEDHQALLSRLLQSYFPPALTDNEIKAVTFPYSGIIFNHTNRFKNIISSAGPGFNFNIRDFDDHQYYVLSCCLILNELFGLQLDFSKPLFYDIPMGKGVIKHYRILYNADFMDIIKTDAAPEITAEQVQTLLDNYDDLQLWKKLFPPRSYILRGFAIVTLYDATIENAVSIFKEHLITLYAPDFRSKVESIFRSIFKNSEIRFGFAVYDADDDSFTTEGIGYQLFSFLLQGDSRKSVTATLCEDAIDHLIKKNSFFAISDVSRFMNSNPGSPVAASLSSQQLASAILAPVVKNNQLLGILEIVSGTAGQLNSINANKLQIIMPFLTDTLERLSVQFQNRIQAVIQDNYTSIHPSVYWKFRNAAKESVRIEGHRNSQLSEITFNGVIPLYGQIDIKGSSEVRNESTRKDLLNQLQSLSQLITRCPPHSIAGDADSIQLTIQKYISDLRFPIQASTEQLITHYLQTDLHAALNHVTDADITPLILEYFKQTDLTTGSFHTYRRMYDATITAINNILATVIDEEQQAAQALYPHYFERSKTDGIDHTIYIGTSIHPDKLLTPYKLAKIRSWQLATLCKMEKAHRMNMGSLPYPLEVTSLVLIHSVPLEIRFRMDEKRFDVNGSYNARFEIIKKRIDKAYVKGSMQRITMPGKLTLVYADAGEALEYTGYIEKLQTDGMLGDDIELLEVEDLQGVTGLRALRVSFKR